MAVGPLLLQPSPQGNALTFLAWSLMALLCGGLLMQIARLRSAQVSAERSAGHIIDTVGEGFWIVDRRGIIQRTNQAYADFSGYRIEEIIGSPVAKFEALETSEEIDAHIGQLLSQGHQTFETRHLLRSGQVRDVEISCTYDATEKHIIAFIRDITDRKLADLAIQDLSELNRLIIENSESGIMVHKASGECIIANRAAASIVGTDLDTLLKHNFRTSRSWRESGELDLAIKALNTGQTQLHNMKMQTIYGKAIWCLGSLARLNLKGEPYLLTMFTDIMESKMAETSLRLAKERAEGALERATQAERSVITASEEVQKRLGQELHDGLGQKLTGAALQCKALTDRLVAMHLPESEIATRLVTLLNDAIDETRSIARGLMPVELKSNGLVDALQQLSDKIPEFSGMSSSFDWDTLPNISDEAAFNLYRIAQEAVNNAIKHSRGSEVIISLQCGKPGEVRLCISDNGHPFANHDAAVQSHEGIGLQVMQFRAQMIGAELDIHTDPATGTDVIATLSKEPVR